MILSSRCFDRDRKVYRLQAGLAAGPLGFIKVVELRSQKAGFGLLAEFYAAASRWPCRMLLVSA
jgi:hypothetical protein